MLGSGFAVDAKDDHPTPLSVTGTITLAFYAVLRFMYTDTVELKKASLLNVTCFSHCYFFTTLHKQ